MEIKWLQELLQKNIWLRKMQKVRQEETIWKYQWSKRVIHQFQPRWKGLLYLRAIYRKKEMGVWCFGKIVMCTQHLYHKLFCLLIWAGSCPCLSELMSVGVKCSQCPYTGDSKNSNSRAVLWGKFNSMKAKKRSPFRKPQQLWILLTSCKVDLPYLIWKLSMPSLSHELHFQRSAHKEQDLQAQWAENLYDLAVPLSC